MTAICLPTDEQFETGVLVYFDETTKKATSTDTGVVLGISVRVAPGFNLNGRQWYSINGPLHYARDYYVWNEELQTDFEEINNGYSPFNELNDPGVVTIVTSGVAALKLEQRPYAPAEWIELQEPGQEFQMYLVK